MVHHDGKISNLGKSKVFHLIISLWCTLDAISMEAKASLFRSIVVLSVVIDPLTKTNKQ